MKRIAVMQPYFLPYIGYFQLMASVDRFVVFDDVNYITRGWVNRNRMLIDGRPHWFTLPLRDASQNRLICETTLLPERAWRDKLLRSFRLAYARAPGLVPTMALLERVLGCETLALDVFLLHSLQQLAEHLALDTEIVPSSRGYGNAGLRGQQRILDICSRERATSYLNAPGGQALYDAEAFAAAGVRLEFIAPRLPVYPQGRSEHVAGLSIIDTLMFNELAQVRSWVRLDG